MRRLDAPRSGAGVTITLPPRTCEPGDVANIQHALEDLGVRVEHDGMLLSLSYEESSVPRGERGCFELLVERRVDETIALHRWAGHRTPQILGVYRWYREVTS